jgi:outer membrane receptor for monomeric catechols
MLRTIVIVAVCLCNGAFAVAGGRHRHAPVSVKGTAPAATLAADRDPYADPAAPYKADRLSLPPRGEPILNTPGQTTVLTRQVLDDMNATTLRDALRSTAGVTVGR